MLIASRRFLPLFTVQMLNALNDNLFKNALVVLVIFRSAEGGAVLVALSGGIFLLPYLLISATAGQLADKIDKARLIWLSQLAAVLLMVAGAGALLSGNVAALLAVLFGLGAHAAFFGPLKYGILPELLAPADVLRGNALVEAGTFAAILLGTIAGGVLIGGGNGPAIVGGAGVAVSLAGLAAAFAIPALPAADPALKLRANVAAETVALIGAARANRRVWSSVLGLSWFWALGATFLAQFPVLAQGEFHADNRVVTLLLTAFALGVGLGSLAAGRLAPRAGTAPAAAVALTLFTWGFAALSLRPDAALWTTPSALLLSPSGLCAFLCLFGAAGCGGLYSVPLYATLQQASDPVARARMVATNNVVNAVFIVASAVAIAALAGFGWRPWSILVGTGCLNLVAAALLWRSLRATMLP
ncbi:MAG: MFS transporter [Acetobacteraceae bacterium]|nr:MFS transporter [Acetobacteraceae bacterium]